MPFTPGTLSEASPMIASTSITCSGSGAELGVDLLGPLDHEVDLGLEDVVQPDLVRDQLHHVLVAGHDADLVARLARAGREGADHVVGLVARDLEELDPMGAHDPDVLKLLDHLLRRSLARGLVLGVALVPERGALRVEGHGDQVWLLLARRMRRKAMVKP